MDDLERAYEVARSAPPYRGAEPPAALLRAWRHALGEIDLDWQGQAGRRRDFLRIVYYWQARRTKGHPVHKFLDDLESRLLSIAESEVTAYLDEREIPLEVATAWREADLWPPPLSRRKALFHDPFKPWSHLQRSCESVVRNLFPHRTHWLEQWLLLDAYFRLMSATFTPYVTSAPPWLSQLEPERGKPVVHVTVHEKQTKEAWTGRLRSVNSKLRQAEDGYAGGSASRGPRPVIGAVQQVKLLARRHANTSVAALAEEYGLHRNVLTRHLKRIGEELSLHQDRESPGIEESYAHN